MNDHVITLEHARDKLISRRRSLAVALLLNPEEVEQFIRIQNAVAAVEQTLSHERAAPHRAWAGRRLSVGPVILECLSTAEGKYARPLHTHQRARLASFIFSTSRAKCRLARFFNHLLGRRSRRCRSVLAWSSLHRSADNTPRHRSPQVGLRIRPRETARAS